MSERIEMDSLDFVGDLKKGRPTLGNLMRVSVYRLLVYSMKAVLTKELGKERADKLFYSAGMLAGQTIFRGILKEEKKDFNLFDEIKDLMEKCKIGLFEVKQFRRVLYQDRKQRHSLNNERSGRLYQKIL